jgi:endonuclease-3
MPETAAATRARARAITARLEKAYPDAAIALRFETPLQLLVATILAAQCTDERVNQVTPGLFATYRTAADFAGASPATLEGEVRSTGFFRAKTRAIIGMARALVERHGGEVPRTLEALTALPGVGRKTANVVLGNAFGIPGIAVDTHVFRVSQRLGLARADDPDRVESQLAEVIPRPRWTRFCHLVQAHGRRVCLARSPACPACPVRALCPWPGKTAGGAAAGGRRPVPARRARRARRAREPRREARRG